MKGLLGNLQIHVISASLFRQKSALLEGLIRSAWRQTRAPCGKTQASGACVKGAERGRLRCPGRARLPCGGHLGEAPNGLSHPATAERRAAVALIWASHPSREEGADAIVGQED